MSGLLCSMSPRRGWTPTQGAPSGSCWSSTRRGAPSSWPPTSWTRPTSSGTGLLSSIVASQYLRVISFILSRLKSILAGSFAVAPHSISSPDMVLATIWLLWSNNIINKLKLKLEIRLRGTVLMESPQPGFRRRRALLVHWTVLRRMKASQTCQRMKPS